MLNLKEEIKRLKYSSVLPKTFNLFICNIKSLLILIQIKMLLFFGAENVSSVHFDFNKKGILLLVEVLTQALDDTTIAVEGKWSSNFKDQKKRIIIVL